MATGVAHELNQPLTSIHLLSQVMEQKIKRGETLDQETLTGFFNQVGDHTSRMTKIIDQLLSFSRTKEHQINCKKVVVANVIEKSLMLSHYQLTKSNIEVTFNCSNTSVQAYIDPDKLQQVLINLFMNARDAMEKSNKKNISISLEQLPEKEAFEILVKDNGHGMTKEQLTQLFTPFYTTKPNGKGTGLGLFISYGIVEQHGGSMQAESSPGEGTTFQITLPLDASKLTQKAITS